MRCFISIVPDNPLGFAEEYELTSESIRIGRDAKQNIVLDDPRVALKHASIELGKNNTFVMKSHTALPIKLNGKPVTNQLQKLRIKDEISIAAFRIVIQKPSQGYDLVLKQSQDKLDQPGTAIRKNAKSLRDLSKFNAIFNKRRLSWLGFLGVLLFSLIIPATAHYYAIYDTKLASVKAKLESKQAKTKSEEAKTKSKKAKTKSEKAKYLKEATNLSKKSTRLSKEAELLETGAKLADSTALSKLRNILVLPSNMMWSSGPLHDAHKTLENQCEACHVKPFVSVEDEACEKCHNGTLEHFDPTDFTDSEAKHGGKAVICLSCHKEHDGKEDVLVRNDEKFCTDCHTDITESFVGTKLRNASDFPTNHPEFERVVKAEAKGKIFCKGEDNAYINPDYNLIFPHDVHLKPLNSPKRGKNTILECKDCHTPEPGGASMQDISMETHCGDCHTLAFDPNNKEEVPHAKLELIIDFLQKYYSKKILFGEDININNPSSAESQVIKRCRRLPGRRCSNLSRVERELIRGVASREATKKLETIAKTKEMEIADGIIKVQGCATCHKLTDNKDEETLNISVSIEFQSQNFEKIPHKWLEKANFTHAKHITMACEDCHDDGGDHYPDASTSSCSEDLLLPGITNCQECHGNQHTQGKLASTCIDCHGYHIDQKDDPKQTSDKDESNL